MDVFEHIGLGKLIDSTLGKRDASWNSFKYSTNVKFHQADMLARIMDRVKLILGVTIKNFRA